MYLVFAPQWVKDPTASMKWEKKAANKKVPKEFQRKEERGKGKEEGREGGEKAPFLMRKV
jgi:hypothetical protein